MFSENAFKKFESLSPFKCMLLTHCAIEDEHAEIKHGLFGIIPTGNI